MSLTGNLEDLPLLDIIQIVSFSKKTGFLTIRTPSGEGAIVFDDGFVISSFTWDSAPLDARVDSLAPAEREAAIRRRIEVALEHLIRLREGQFSFSLTTETPARIGSRDISRESLSPGINPQELLLDLARGMDEDRRDSSAALEASFVDAPEPEPEPQPSEAEPEAALPEEEEPTATLEAEAEPFGSLVAGPTNEAERAAASAEPAPELEPQVEAEAAPAARTILLVDDEPDIRAILRESFEQAGYTVVEGEDPESAVKAAQRLKKEQTEFLLVTDLGMPTTGGASFQGGFEIIKRLGKMHLKPPILMMTDRLSASLQTRAKQMGVASFVFKPGLSRLDPEQFEADMRGFAGKLVSELLPRLDQARAAAGQAEPSPRTLSRAAEGPAAREMQVLQQGLDALRRTADPAQISQLVMKTARHFVERGVLFLVKEDEVRGLGGFGRAPDGATLGVAVRDVVIPLAEPSVFQEVVADRRTVAGPIPEDPWTGLLYERIGRFEARSAAFVPLLTHREVTAILFGDNPGTGREPERIDVLEVFLNQAGVALENAFLQRKLELLQAKG